MADDEDSSFAIAAILALGAISLFTFPLIGHYLHLSDHAYGVWAGLAVDNTAEATAAGALYSDAAAKLAVLTKTTRNALIGFVVLAYAIYWVTAGSGRWQQSYIPLAEISQVCIGILADLRIGYGGIFTKDQNTALANLPLGILLTFAGVGLRTNFREMRKQVASLCRRLHREVVIAIYPGLVIGAGKFFGF